MEVADSFAAHLERHEALCAKWGRPEPYDRYRAIVMVGAAKAPEDVIAFRYSSREAAQAFADSNLEHYGIRSLGIAESEDGVIGVTHVPANYVRADWVRRR
jgi:hypothetical protein